MVDDIWFLNPLTVFDKMYVWMTGYHAIDLIEKNDDNQDVYIPNQWSGEKVDTHDGMYPVLQFEEGTYDGPYIQEIYEGVDNWTNAMGMNPRYADKNGILKYEPT